MGLEREIFLDDRPIDPPALALKVDVAQWLPANNINVDEDVLACESNHDKTNLVARSCIWDELREAEEAVGEQEDAERVINLNSIVTLIEHGLNLSKVYHLRDRWDHEEKDLENWIVDHGADCHDE